MRVVSEAIRAAIEDYTSYRNYVWAKLYPSRTFFQNLEYDNSPAGADAVGIQDDPMPQDIGVPAVAPENPQVFTFYNDSGTLKVMENGSSTENSLSVSITGKPGVCGSRLYRISSGDVYRHVITWGSPPSLDGGTNVATPDEDPLHVHGVSDTRCVVLTDGDGGIRASVISGTTVYKSTDRFMFPTYIDYTSGSPANARTIDSLAIFSGALELDGKVFVYVSNCWTGSVQGQYWDEDTREWSDIFTAVPTELHVSLCEFRVANAYTHGGVAYICGQFRRTENIETDYVYSMILKSLDGKTFSIDRFSAITNVGYRFLSKVGADAILYISNCNRICYASVSYTHNGTNNDSLVLDIPNTGIVSFNDSDTESADIVFAAGNEVLPFDKYMEEGNKLEVYFGYETTSGSAGLLYGSYIIDTTGFTVRDGNRALNVKLVNESLWKLQSHTSPFYTEIFGKSALFDDLTAESGSLFPADGATRLLDWLNVDFWQSVPFSYDDITGINVLESGGVNFYQAAGSHKLGIRTIDLKELLFLENLPTISSGSVGVRIFGWSHEDGTSGLGGDTVELVLATKPTDSEEITYHISTEGKKWTQTYPTTIAGEDPIEFTMTGLTVGHEIKYIGLVFEAGHSTWLCPARVSLMSGVSSPYQFDDLNTPWAYSTSGSGFEIPNSGRPYIMFAQKPFNAYNFSVAASFEHNAQGSIAGYPTAVGLVGLAENGRNYVLGRYDRTTNRAEIVKVRNGIESILAYDTPSSGSPGEMVDILFTHRNGHFEVFMKSSDIWNRELAYDWTAADGWMYTSETTTTKCGIYGYIGAPSFRITGLTLITQDNVSSADAVGYLPLNPITDFPTSGRIRIGENKYDYTGKVTYGLAGYMRGPWQFRQSDHYPDGYGLECRDFYWTNADDFLEGYLVAVNDGSCYVISGSEWQVYDRTAGVITYRYNRSRHYAENASIGDKFRSTSNKVYITGGLTGLTRVSGEQTRHSENEMAVLDIEGSILCHWYYGAGGEDDVTVEDLVSKICSYAGAKAEFPGDTYYATLDCTGGVTAGSPGYLDGFDIHFNVPSTTDFTLGTTVTDPRYVTDTGLRFYMNSLGGNDYRLNLYSYPSNTFIERINFTAKDQQHKYRVLFHDDFIGFYMDGKWVHTFCLPDLTYPVTNTITLSGAFTATEVLLQELCDWREAIYIDLETDAMSAISSVVQERPVESNGKSDGSLAMWYQPIRDTVTQVRQPRLHVCNQVTPRDGASDAIVYSSDEVKCLQYQPYLRTYGFATKVMRYPNLKSGALKAARVVLERAFESRNMYQFEIRPDIRIESGDYYAVNYRIENYDRDITNTIIVESVALRYDSRQQSMLVSGRGYVT